MALKPNLLPFCLLFSRILGIHERRFVNLNKSRTLILVGGLNLTIRNKNFCCYDLFYFILFYCLELVTTEIQVSQMSHVSC